MAARRRRRRRAAVCRPAVTHEIDERLGTDAHPFGRSFRPLLPHEAEEIADMRDIVRRNLRITQGYHDLTMGMTELLGSKNVSWCAFATWASRSAGHFIRGGFVPDMVHAYLGRIDRLYRSLHLARRLLAGSDHDTSSARSLLVASIERMCHRVCESVGVGNQIVFAELAPLFSRMIQTFRGATTYDPRAIRRFLSMLRPGPTTEGGQGLLIQAFGNYYRAMFETHPKRKAERILLANNQIGLHEQTRLQGPIMGALSAPAAELVWPGSDDRARGPLDAVIERAIRPLAAWLQAEWCWVATRWLIRLDLPLHRLYLGQDVPGPSPTSMFPAELATIDDDALAAFLYRLDFTPNSTAGSRARNWGDLADRMRYVVDFFRAYQQDRNLYRQPFTHAQVEVIRAGGIPLGDL